MNRFADYFSNYVNDDTITYIGNGDITSFTVSRQDRELAVGLNLESFIDYGIIENSQNQIARAMELKKVHINPRFPKSEFSLDNIERILEYVRHESPAANGFFDGCEAELEDRTLTLCLALVRVPLRILRRLRFLRRFRLLRPLSRLDQSTPSLTLSTRFCHELTPLIYKLKATSIVPCQPNRRYASGLLVSVISTTTIARWAPGRGLSLSRVPHEQEAT